jgi:hypothetical protein
MIKIKEITLGLPARQADCIMIRPIINNTQSLDCNTYYEVLSKLVTVTNEEGGVDTNSIATEILAAGNVPISEEEYLAWGADNTFIEDIVLTKLGLQRF